MIHKHQAALGDDRTPGARPPTKACAAGAGPAAAGPLKIKSGWNGVPRAVSKTGDVSASFTQDDENQSLKPVRCQIQGRWISRVPKAKLKDLNERLGEIPNGFNRWFYLLFLSYALLALSASCVVLAVTKGEWAAVEGAILFAAPGLALLALAWRTRFLARSRP